MVSKQIRFFLFFFVELTILAESVQITLTILLFRKSCKDASPVNTVTIKCIAVKQFYFAFCSLSFIVKQCCRQIGTIVKGNCIGCFKKKGFLLQLTLLSSSLGVILHSLPLFSLRQRKRTTIWMHVLLYYYTQSIARSAIR